NGRTGFNGLHDLVFDCLRVCAGDRHGNSASATLPHSKDGCLAYGAASRLEFLIVVFICFLPADIGFINFDDASKLLKVGTTSFPEPVQNEPSRLLRDADFL